MIAVVQKVPFRRDRVINPTGAQEDPKYYILWFLAIIQLYICHVINLIYTIYSAKIENVI